MKVLLINGSPKENGNTFTALSEVAKTLDEQEPNLVSPTTNNDKWDESYIYDRRK